MPGGPKSIPEKVCGSSWILLECQQIHQAHHPDSCKLLLYPKNRRLPMAWKSYERTVWDIPPFVWHCNPARPRRKNAAKPFEEWCFHPSLTSHSCAKPCQEPLRTVAARNSSTNLFQSAHHDCTRPLDIRNCLIGLFSTCSALGIFDQDKSVS